MKEEKQFALFTTVNIYNYIIVYKYIYSYKYMYIYMYNVYWLIPFICVEKSPEQYQPSTFILLSISRLMLVLKLHIILVK